MAESYHDGRFWRRLKEDPEFRAEFERQRREIGRIASSVCQRDEFTAET
jgi:hypothetical protein